MSVIRVKLADNVGIGVVQARRGSTLAMREHAFSQSLVLHACLFITARIALPLIETQIQIVGVDLARDELIASWRGTVCSAKGIGLLRGQCKGLAPVERCRRGNNESSVEEGDASGKLDSDDADRLLVFSSNMLMWRAWYKSRECKRV